MAHYLEIREVDKELVKGVKVFNHDALEGQHTTVFETWRTFMNDVVKNYYDVHNGEWDHDMFVMSEDDIHWLEESVIQSLLGGLDDQEEIEKLGEFCAALNGLDFSKDKAYLICWGK